MKEQMISFYGAGAQTLHACIWEPEGEVKGILQITHGMTEHIGRYAALAALLTREGIAVAGFDLRGHGRNDSDPVCASFGEGGWEASLEDMKLFHTWLLQRYPEVPCFELGFSLGSFLLREYLSRCDLPVAGAVIMGTGQQPGFLLGIMMGVVKGQIRKAGFDSTTPLVQKLSFGTYNAKFSPNRTPSDWLCADNDNLDVYLADPLCRADISAGLFWQLLGAMKRTGASGTYQGWRKDMPLLLLSGKDDPVGDLGKGVEMVCKAMTCAGLRRVSMQLYPGARHDLLHEHASGAAEAAGICLRDWILKELNHA